MVTTLFIFIFVNLILNSPININNLELHLIPLLIMIFDFLFSNNEIFSGNFYLSFAYINLYILYIFIILYIGLLTYPFPYFCFYLSSINILLLYQYQLLLLLICCFMIYLLDVIKKSIILLFNMISRNFQNNQNQYQYINIPSNPNINYGTYYVNSPYAVQLSQQNPIQVSQQNPIELFI